MAPETTEIQQVVGDNEETQSSGKHTENRPTALDTAEEKQHAVTGQQSWRDDDVYKQLLTARIRENKLSSMVDLQDNLIDRLVKMTRQSIKRFSIEWHIPLSVAPDIIQLSLYDIILHIDNSGSMRLEEHGERIADLKCICQFGLAVHQLFDDDPTASESRNEGNKPSLQVCFMNSDSPTVVVRSRKHLDQILAQCDYTGLTRTGTQLDNKVVGPYIDKMRDGKDPKTSPDALKPYGPGALAFQFIQVGNDASALAILKRVKEGIQREYPIDCTPNFEILQELMYTADPPAKLTPGMWLMKAFLGAIDQSYDSSHIWTQVDQNTLPSTHKIPQVNPETVDIVTDAEVESEGEAEAKTKAETEAGVEAQGVAKA